MPEEEKPNQRDRTNGRKPRAKKSTKKEMLPREWNASHYEFEAYVHNILRGQSNALRGIRRKYEKFAGDIEERMIELIGMLNAIEAARQSGEYNIHYHVGKNGFGYRLIPRECGFGIGKGDGIEKMVKNPK